jgi:hypothetical protein
MTRTEERLTDALRASASRVRDDELRPLPGGLPDRAISRRPGAWRSRLAPAAAAAGVALVIGVVVAVHSNSGPDNQPGPATSADVTSPGYAATSYGPSGAVEVRAVTTGKPVGIVQPPFAPAGLTTMLAAVAPGPDDRTFYAEYDVYRSSGSQDDTRTSIYRFGLTSSGTLTPMRPVNGGEVTGMAAAMVPDGTLAVSPDGDELAFAITSEGMSRSVEDMSAENMIVVLNMRTGSRITWQGPMSNARGKPAGFTLIPDLSWSADGRSVVFTEVSRPGGAFDHAAVLSLSPASGGGSLDQAHVLLPSSTRSPALAAAGAAPDGSNLVVVTARTDIVGHVAWAYLTVLDVSRGSGAIVKVLGQARIRLAHATDSVIVLLAAAPGNGYFLLSYGDAISGVSQLDLLSDGVVHPL